MVAVAGVERANVELLTALLTLAELGLRVSLRRCVGGDAVVLGPEPLLQVPAPARPGRSGHDSEHNDRRYDDDHDPQPCRHVVLLPFGGTRRVEVRLPRSRHFTRTVRPCAGFPSSFWLWCSQPGPPSSIAAAP